MDIQKRLFALPEFHKSVLALRSQFGLVPKKVGTGGVPWSLRLLAVTDEFMASEAYRGPKRRLAALHKHGKISEAEYNEELKKLTGELPINKWASSISKILDKYDLPESYRLSIESYIGTGIVSGVGGYVQVVYPLNRSANEKIVIEITGPLTVREQREAMAWAMAGVKQYFPNRASRGRVSRTLDRDLQTLQALKEGKDYFSMIDSDTGTEKDFVDDKKAVARLKRGVNRQKKRGYRPGH